MVTKLQALFLGKRVFLLCCAGVLLVFALDILTVVSIGTLSQDAGSSVQEIQVAQNERYAYIGFFLLLSAYLALLGVMCIVLLVNAWNGQVRLIPVLLIWHSSLGIISSVGNIGRLLSIVQANVFSDVADGFAALSFLPLLLCVVYYMKRYSRFIIPFALADCLCSSAFLLTLAWHGSEATLYVTEAMSEWFFLISVLAVVVFCCMEWKTKNTAFCSYPFILLLSFLAAFLVRLLSLLAHNGFSFSFELSNEVYSAFSLSWLRSSFLQWFLLFSTFLLMAMNTVRQYHQMILRAQSLQLRDEANREYAKNLQRFEMQVREMKHDIANTMNVAATLCANEEYRQLDGYLQNMTEHIMKIGTEKYCSHILVNYLLLMFAERFRKAKAEFRVKAYLPSELTIEDNDLSSELNNILQNALEAIMKLPEEERWVEITIRMEKSIVRIDCRNPYREEPVRADNGLLRTSKSDARHHGLGMMIICEIAEKYGGVAVPHFGNGIFEWKIALPVGIDR